MAFKTLQKITWKITKWLVVLSVLYSACVFIGVENLLPVTRVVVRSSKTDLTILSLLCDLLCLLLTAEFLRRRLTDVTADTNKVLTTGVSLVAFMGPAVFFLCQGALEYLFCALFKTKIEPVHPMVLKFSFYYLTVSMYLFFVQMARLSGRSAALINVASLVVLWTVVVSAVSWGFLYLGLHKKFMQVDTLVDVKKVDYSPLLVISVLAFLVVDSGWRNGRSRGVVNVVEPIERQ